ncbi:MAG: metalloregulator ArsR/SmtB family transcription factor, partial [Thermoanaerobaculia bacterium]
MGRPRFSLDRLFGALADPTRLRILNLLAAGEICVCYFVEVLGEPQPKISRHLAYLRRSGLVETRRDGKWIHYGLAKDLEGGARKILEAVLEELAANPRMQRERAALARACCGVR